MSDSTQASDSKGSGQDQLKDHEYDGIQEYDNPLPRWWVWLFWGTIIYSVAYGVHYHLAGTGKSVAEEYQAEVEAAGSVAPTQGMNEAALARLMANSAATQRGKQVYDLRCLACHADKGQGQIGPNLTDDHWISGEGRLEDIFETVAKGVLAKGMPAWEKQLSPQELADVVAFVGTLRGKNIPGKAAEGKKVGSP